VLTEAIEVVRPEGDICVIATYGQEVSINATHLTRTSLNMKDADLYDFENITQAFEDSIKAQNMKAVVKMN